MEITTAPSYDGDDLGLSFTDGKMVLKVWSESAEAMTLRIYANSQGQSPPSFTSEMNVLNSGVWSVDIPMKFQGQFYTVQARFDDGLGLEVPDPYAKAVGTNGLRGQLIDPNSISPKDWDNDAPPSMVSLADVIIYELHVRDFSIQSNSGFKHVGKYLAFMETGLKDAEGNAIGIDHLIDLGITHVHLLPVFDFMSIDESKPNKPQYNWGYDPQNYFVPEGSYATDAADGAVRILEFKIMVQALHRAGIRVVMDVVYNHTGRIDGLSLEETSPGSYYRQWPDGKYSDASACGNETASDKPKFRNLMIESLIHWMEVYHVDGFRFDLMGIHDQATMNEIAEKLLAIRPDLILYGEGWTASDSPLPEGERALKKYTYKMPGIAAFSDDMRDGIKGHWSQHEAKGFIGGKWDLRESVKFGIVGAIDHKDIDYAKVNNSDTAWAATPTACVNYVSCHDNHTLYDKLRLTNPEADEDAQKKLQILANAIVLTSQGIPFLHAGVEMMRTKQGVENSYKSSDSINAIDWSLKTKYLDVFDQYKWLIALRKKHSCFRLGTAKEVKDRLQFLTTQKTMIAYRLSCAEEDEWKEAIVIINADSKNRRYQLPDNAWKISYLGKPESGTSTAPNFLTIPAHSMAILFKKRLN